MTSAVRDHFHLWAVGSAFAETRAHEYIIELGGIKDAPVAFVSHTRALNAAGHAHVLVDINGAPILAKDVALRVIATLAQRAALLLLQGKQCYYIPITHMGDLENHTDVGTPPTALSPGYKVFMMAVADDQNIDPMLDYWRVTINLKDDSI